MCAAELQEYELKDGEVYIVVVESKDVLQEVVDAFQAAFPGAGPARVMKALGMFSGPMNQEHVRAIHHPTDGRTNRLSVLRQRPLAWRQNAGEEQRGPRVPLPLRLRARIRA